MLFRSKDVVFKVMYYDQYGLSPEATREISILIDLDHPNIVKLLNVMYAQNKVILVLEAVQYDLGKYLENLPPNSVIQEDMVRSVIKQLVRGIAYCHALRIYHRDLAPRNILYDDKLNVKIIDFGLAGMFDLMGQKKKTKTVTTVWFRAPELFFGQRDYSAPVDIWSLGAIFAQLASGSPLFYCDHGTCTT